MFLGLSWQEDLCCPTDVWMFAAVIVLLFWHGAAQCFPPSWEHTAFTEAGFFWVWTLESLWSFLLIVLSYVLRLCTKPCLWYCMRLLSLRSLPKLTLLSEEIIQFKLHFQWACSALGGSSCNPGSLRYSCIHFHCLRVWLFLNVLENPSKCRLLCYKFIIQFGLNDGLTVPTAL